MNFEGVHACKLLYMTYFNCACLFLFSSDVQGVVTLSNMTSKISKGNVKSTDKVIKVLYKQFEMVSDYIKFHNYLVSMHVLNITQVGLINASRFICF